MTPEKAHELLDNAKPGPWEARATYANGTPRPDTTREMRAGDEYLGIMHAPVFIQPPPLRDQDTTT